MKTAACVAVSLCAAAWAQQPRVDNARMETRAVSGGLESTFRSIVAAQTAPAWVGYSVPIVRGDHQMCCWNNNVMCGCSLEPRNSDQTFTMSNNQTVKLEGPRELVVLFRVESRQTDKIRTFTPDCNLDAGGLPFIWLTGVTPPESIRLLLSMAKDTSGGSREEHRKSDGATAAIAMHADPAADQALEELVAQSQPEQVRRQAIFWLGNARGQRGFEIVSRVVREDPSDKIREHAIFALTQNKDPRALEVVASVAHKDPEPARPRPGTLLAGPARRAKDRRIGHQRCHRQRSRNRSQEESRFRAHPDALRRRCSAADSGGPHQPESGSAQAGHVLVRTK